MADVVAVQTPQDTATGTMVVDLSGRRLWRKQILPLTTIEYKGRKIRFDRQYHLDLVRSFKEKAVDQSSFQLADANNAHTNDPERQRGELVELKAEKEGLFGYFELGDKGEAVVTANPKLGVSARIVENYRRADGKTFPRVLQHTLGTLDPRITGMKPWESVELSNEQVDSVIDLAGRTYKEDGDKMPDGEGKHVVELSTTQLERLSALLERDAEEQELIDNLDLTDLADGDEDELQDEEETEVEAELSNGRGNELLLSTVSSLQEQVVMLTNQVHGKETEAELTALANTGLAPAIIEAARPLLSIGSGTIELANGDQVSPSEQVRTLLRTVLQLSHNGTDVVNLDTEVGQLTGDNAVDEARKAQLAELDALYGS